MVNLVDLVTEVAATYGCGPEEVLQWPESRFWMWFLSVQDYNEKEKIALSSLISLATWSPSEYKKAISDHIEEEDKTVDPRQAIKRAEEIRRMPGSGSKLDPLNENHGGGEDES